GGRIELVDRAVDPGRSYVYRAGFAGAAGMEWSAESQVDVPEGSGFRFGLEGKASHVIAGACDVAFTLAAAGPVDLEAFDVRGRRVAARSEATLAAGRHVLRLAVSAELRPGLYFLRLRQGAAVASGRIIVLGAR
ncbi:MAG: hypothetical protein ABIP29_04315, partial [Candidatus Eisenbacteria bacterium]